MSNVERFRNRVNDRLIEVLEPAVGSAKVRQVTEEVVQIFVAETMPPAAQGEKLTLPPDVISPRQGITAGDNSVGGEIGDKLASGFKRFFQGPKS